MTEWRRPPLMLVASPRSRSEETSPFLRFVRENVEVLRRFSLHCTEGTYYSLMGTGLYSNEEVMRLRPGTDGGMVQVAAHVARGACKAVILLTDPRDISHEEVLTRVVKRITSARGIRLVTTYEDAIRWALYEAKGVSAEPIHEVEWQPMNWADGVPNSGAPLSIDQRTIALTAHDERKRVLIDFVKENRDALTRYRRILATGLSGWTLKLLFASAEQADQFEEEIWGEQWYRARFRLALLSMLEEKDRKDPPEDLRGIIRILRAQLEVQPDPAFAQRVMSLPPGFEGGDALIALEIIENRCDTVLCFYKPTGPFPSIDDVWMYEETCQLPKSFTACVINPSATRGWAEGLSQEVREGRLPVLLNQSLRTKFDLREVIVVDSDEDIDSDELGKLLCRACAGYLNTAISRLIASGGGQRVAVSWGWGMHQIIEQLTDMKQRGELRVPPRAATSEIVWSPSIGVLSTEPELGAGMIAEGLKDFYGGRVEAFARPGYVVSVDQIPPSERNAMEDLSSADIILDSAAPWSTNSGLYKRTGLKPELFPPVGDEVAGTLGGIFLSPTGTPVLPKIELFGLDYDGMKRAALARQSVVVVCGGISRRPILRAAIWARLVSVLVTSRQTAEWLLDQPPEPPTGNLADATFVRVLVEVLAASNSHVQIRVPAWNSERVTSVPIQILPPATIEGVLRGPRPVEVLAVANLAAADESDLNLHDFTPVLPSPATEPSPAAR